MVRPCALFASDFMLTSASGVFPGRGRAIWRDWYTHEVVNATTGGLTTLDAPLGHINVHIRDGSAILLHAKPAYTIEQTRQGPYELLVSQDAHGNAFVDAYIDDGVTAQPTPSRVVKFHAREGALVISSTGTFNVKQLLETVTILGTAKPARVIVGGHTVQSWQYFAAEEKLVVSELHINLDHTTTVSWR